MFRLFVDNYKKCCYNSAMKAISETKYMTICTKDYSVLLTCIANAKYYMISSNIFLTNNESGFIYKNETAITLFKGVSTKKNEAKNEVPKNKI